VAFELLKQLSTFLLGATANSEAFQAFGIALILLVWINYFSRVVVYAASWAHTSPEARAAREARLVADQTVEGPRIDLVAAAGVVRPGAGDGHGPSGRAAFAAGAASMLGVVALVRRRRG
jgi:membrane protein